MFAVPVLLFLLTAVGWGVWWCFQRRWKFSGLDHIPGPKPLPLLGNALEFGTNPIEKLRALVRIQETYGSVSKVWIGPDKIYLLVSDPELAEFFLSSTKHITKSKDYRLFDNWLGNGLLTSTGSYWHKKRKMITPAFHFKILEEFFPHFDSTGDIMIQRLSKKVGKGSFNIYPYVTAFALDSICETAMGTTVNAQIDGENLYVNAIEDMRNVLIERLFSFWKQFDILFPLSREYYVYRKALAVVKGFTEGVIKSRMKSAEDKGQIEDEDEFGRKKRVAFLNLLLESTFDGRRLTAEEIREEVDTFMFEGHDTTASAIGFALYEIANNPDVQDKLHTELSAIFDSDITQVATYQDLQDMKFMDLVIKEVLRLYPSVPMMGRELTEDAEHKGTIFPKGLNIMIFMYHMHRREDLFREATRFNPDRFLQDNMVKKNAFMYVPFSAGPRNCIGQKYAIFEMKMILSKILRNFELVSAGPEHSLKDLSAEVILKSEEGIHLILRKRKHI